MPVHVMVEVGALGAVSLGIAAYEIVDSLRHARRQQVPVEPPSHVVPCERPAYVIDGRENGWV